MKNRLSRYGGQLPKKWRKLKPMQAAIGAATLALPLVVVASTSASAGVNLVVNPGLSQTGPGNFPLCFGKYGYGNNTYSIGTTSKAHDGGKAIQVTISKRTSGARTVLTMENTSCAPWVTPGHQYDLGVWYMSSTPDAEMVLYRHDVKLGWQYWTDLKTLPTARQVPVRVRADAAGAAEHRPDRLGRLGLRQGHGDHGRLLHGRRDRAGGRGRLLRRGGVHQGRLAGNAVLGAGAGHARRADVQRQGPADRRLGQRHQSDFNAGTFQTAVYNPANGTLTKVPTPVDFFCAGHVQLPDGKVLVLGGNKAYPTATHGYEGLNTSYIFNPVTDRYQQVNNLNGGHWYPSATELGNGDVISFGGLDATSGGSVTMEYFKYNPSATDGVGNWLPLAQINQDFDGLGPVPGHDPDAERRAVLHRQPRVRQQRDPDLGTAGTHAGSGRRRHHRQRPERRQPAAAPFTSGRSPACRTPRAARPART